MNLSLVCTNVKQGIWQYERQKTVGRQKVKIQESYTFSMLRNVKDVRIGMAVIKKAQSRNNIRKPLSATAIVNRHNFRKRNILKARQKNDIKYKIEAKNNELKRRHGYDVASSSGLIGMEMQGAMTIFAVNLKRIIKLMGKK